MSWEQFIELINQPLPIIGVSVLWILCAILTILAKTSIGRKSLKELKRQNDELRQKIEQALQDWKDTENAIQAHLEEKTKEIDKSIKDNETYVSGAIKRVNGGITLLANNTHNAKLKNAVKKTIEEEEENGKETEERKDSQTNEK
jgi:hypothetical protein